MHDGMTRKVEAPQPKGSFDAFAARWRATVVLLSGPTAGSEWVVKSAQTSIGRGAGCDWVVEDDTLSKEHAALEFHEGGFRLRDLGSTNGMRVNGQEVAAADLENGDRFQLGDHEFQLVVQESEKAPRTWVVDEG